MTTWSAACQVEPLTAINGWRSQAANSAAGGDPRSTHMAACALDLNGGSHPWEKRTGTRKWKSGYTSAQVGRVRAIIADLGGCIRWGLDYAVGYRDPMHFEVIGTSTQVAAVAARLTAPNSIPATTAPSTTPTRRPIMFVLIQPQRGYHLCGPGYAHRLSGEEWNESVGRLRDAGLIGQFVFEDGPVGQRRFDLAKAALTQPSA